MAATLCGSPMYMVRIALHLLCCCRVFILYLHNFVCGWTQPDRLRDGSISFWWLFDLIVFHFVGTRSDHVPAVRRQGRSVELGHDCFPVSDGTSALYGPNASSPQDVLRAQSQSQSQVGVFVSLSHALQIRGGDFTLTRSRWRQLLHCVISSAMTSPNKSGWVELVTKHVFLGELALMRAEIIHS